MLRFEKCWINEMRQFISWMCDFMFKREGNEAQHVARAWNGAFQYGVTKNAVWLINVMAKSVGRIYHVSRADIHTLDNTKNGNKWIGTI